MEKKLYRSVNDRVFAGVCGGIGEYFAVDTVVIRLLWVVFTVMGGAGLIAYIIAAIIVPLNPVGGTISGSYSGTEGQSSSEHQSGSEHQGSKGNSVVLGIILLLFGGFVIVKDFIPWIPRDILFAAVLIGLGIFFIVKRNK